MYGDSVEFLVEGLGLATMTPEGYEAVIERIGPTAEKLRDRGADAIALMGTSLSFYKGQEFNERLTETIRRATGLQPHGPSAELPSHSRVLVEETSSTTILSHILQNRLALDLHDHGIVH